MEQEANPTPDDQPTRGFIFAYALTFLLVLALVYGMNFAGNGSGLFPSPWRPSRSERGWKARRFEELVRAGNAPKLLILGSSRVMQIRPDYVTAVSGLPSFNFGVSVGGPADFIAQLGYAVDRNAKPQRIIVGLDEQAFNDLPNIYQIQNSAHWGLFHHLPFREELSLGRSVIESVTLATTFDSIQSLRTPAASPEADASAVLLLGDGYLIYRYRTTELAAGRFDAMAAVNQAVHVFHRNVSHEAWNVTERKMTLFREFLQLARANSVTVDVVMLPMHPIFSEKGVVLDRMKAKRDQLRQNLEKLCADEAATWRDFTDSRVYEGDPTLWWDGVHQQPENLRRMTNAIFGLPPAKVVVELPDDAELLAHPPAVTTLTTR